MPGVERARHRVERVDGRVDALLDEAAREHGRRVEVGERVRRRRVGEVVGRHVDRLHRRDRALARRGDPLLELAHLGGERRLVADGARHAAEQRRDLGARLDEAEDVVDEEQHVLALVAEVLRHRQAGEADAQARARRLVHLAEAERDLVDDVPTVARLRLAHLEQEVVALARALADAGEHRHAAVLAGEVRDQLLDQHRLADAGAAEEADLAAADVRRDQVDDLDARLEDLDLRRELVRSPAGRGGSASARSRRPRPCRRSGRRARSRAGRASRRRPAPRSARRVDDVAAAREAVGRVHRDGADAVVAEMLLHLGHELAAVGARDAQRRVDLGQLVREDGVDDDALDLDQLADVLASAVRGHVSPEKSPGKVRSVRGGSRRAPAAKTPVSL